MSAYESKYQNKKLLIHLSGHSPCHIPIHNSYSTLNCVRKQKFSPYEDLQTSKDSHKVRTTKRFVRQKVRLIVNGTSDLTCKSRFLGAFYSSSVLIL